MKKYRTFAALALCAALCLLSACGSSGGSESLAGKIKNESGVKISQPLDSGRIEEVPPLRPGTGELKLAEKNPLNVSDVSLDGEGYASVACQTVFGLTSVALQNKINARCETIARGLAQNGAGDDCYTSVYVSFSCNDVLSIVGLHSRMEAESIGGDAASVTDAMETFNLDLRSGEELRLSDLFAGDFDPSSVVGSIPAETKFYLSTDGLNLISEDGSVTCYGFAAFGENWAIAEDCDPSLYTDPSAICPMMLNTYLGESATESDWTDCGRDNAYLSYSITAPAEFPSSLRFEAMSMIEARRPDEETVLALAKANPGTWISGNYDVTCGALGDYYTMQEICNYNVNPDLTWVFETNCAVYGPDLQKLGLSDLFTPDYDYRSVFRQGLQKVWMSSYGQSELYCLADGSSGELSDAVLNDLITNGSFLLGNDRLTFYTDALLLTDYSFGAEDPNVYATPLTLVLSYDDIGSGNLTIF